MPKIKFGTVVIKNLKPTRKSVEYFDMGRDKGAGALGLRISPRGKRTWFLMYAIGSKSKRFTMGTFPLMGLKDARDTAISLMAGINAGEDPQLRKIEYRAAETFSELWEDYIRSPKFLDKADSNRVEEQRKYNRLLKQTLGSMRVQDIRIKHVAPIVYDLAATAPVSANRLFSLINFVFRFALNRGLIDIHPLFGMDRPAHETPRSRYLKPDEIKILYPKLRDIFRLILLTAQRPGEVMSITSDEVDLEDRLWTIPASKTKVKKEHVVPLSVQAMEIIEPLCARHKGFLFPTRSSKGHIVSVEQIRYRLWREVKVDPWTSHDLRRTARTLLSRIGVRTDIAERLLNHSRGRIEATYDHYGFLPEKRIALDRLGNEIDKITGVAKPAKAEIVTIRKQA